MVGDVGSTLVIVLAAVGCVLLIACANAINLLIARALNRSRELAIRSALGASRGRLLQYLVVESAVLTAGAAALGAGVAALAIKLVATYGEGYIPRVAEVELSVPVLGWLAGLAVASGLLVLLGGLVPAMQGPWLRVDRALRSGGRSSTDGPAARRLRRALVAAEFALATPLIVAAVLVMTSLDRLSHVRVGIDTERVLTGGVTLSGASYSRATDRKAFWDRALERLTALAGRRVRRAGRQPAACGQRQPEQLRSRGPPDSRPVRTNRSAPGSPSHHSSSRPSVYRSNADGCSTSTRYVTTSWSWIARGPTDSSPARKCLAAGSGAVAARPVQWTTVVGIVGNVKWMGLDAAEDGTVYWPHVDRPTAYFVLRAAGDPAALTTTLRRAVYELDPSLALSNIATGDDLLSGALAAPRYLSVLVGMFALAALLLSVVGIYGVMAHFVEQHTRDIGIRLALGGEPAGVRRMVVLQGLRLVVAGVGPWRHRRVPRHALSRDCPLWRELHGRARGDCRARRAPGDRGHRQPRARPASGEARSSRDPARELSGLRPQALKSDGRACSF